jgi:serine phosphatase RsbU (regulator of sigma subunit)
VASFFGDEKIERAIRHFATATAEDLVHGLINQVTDFESGAPRYDDIACVSLVYRGRMGD